MRQLFVKNKTKSDDKGIIHNKNFLLLFGGRLISQFGESVYSFSIVWYLLDQSIGATIHTGAIMTLSIIPSVIFGPAFGAILDRCNRKGALIISDLVRGILLIILGVMIGFSERTLELLYIGTVLLGTFSALYNPAYNSIIPNIVAPDYIQKVVSINSITANVTRILGLLTAGLLYSWLGIAGVFYINAVSYLLSGISQLFIRIPRKNNQTIFTFGYKSIKSNVIKISHEIGEGYTYLKNSSGLYILFWFLFILNIFSIPLIQICIPYIYNRILGATSFDLALTEVVFAVGYIIGALIAAMLPKVEKLYKRIGFSYSIASILVAFLLVPILLANNLCLTYKLAIYILLSFLCGFFMAMGDIPINVIFQNKVIDSIRGRVYSLLNTFTNMAMPIGYILLSFLSDKIPMIVILASVSLFLLTCSQIMIASKHIQTL